MDDVAISALPVASRAESGDFIIINKQNLETRRIDIDNFGVGATFDPIIVKFKLADGTTEKTETFPKWNKREPINDWAVSTDVPVTVPGEATHLLCFHYAWNRWEFDTSITSGPLWSYRQYARHWSDVKNGSGEWLDNPDPIRTRLFMTHNVAMAPDWVSSWTENNNRKSQITSTKTKILKINVNADSSGMKTVVINGGVDLQMGGTNTMTANMGNMYILPITVDNEVGLLNSELFSTNYDSENDGWDYDMNQGDADKADAISSGQRMRNKALHTIEAINSKLDITERYLANTSESNPIPDWPTQKTILEGLLVDLYDIIYRNLYKNSALNTEQDTDTALSAVYGAAGSLIAVPFKFESDLGVTPAMVTLP